jgi:adenylate cyclase
MGFKPSRMNPNLCARCCEALPPGGLEIDIVVLFADVRGSTALGEQIGASEFARLLNRFYCTATKVLINYDAIIDKLIGDKVMALFIPGIAGPDYRRRASEAAVALVVALSGPSDLPVGAAVNCGIAFVGNVGSEHVVDFTALGDPINTGARLQAAAAAGEVVMPDVLYREVSDQFPDAEPRTLIVHGREKPIDVHIVRPAAQEPPGPAAFREGRG